MSDSSLYHRCELATVINCARPIWGFLISVPVCYIFDWDTVKLQPKETTLTDKEIEAVSEKIIEKVTKATGGALRG